MLGSWGRGLWDRCWRVMAEMADQSASYPVVYSVEPQLHNRNRLTAFFRIILAIPHLTKCSAERMRLHSVSA